MKIKLLYFCSDYMIGLTQAQTEQIEHLCKENSIDLYCVSSENEQETGLHDRIKKTGANINIIKGLDEHKNFKVLSLQIKELIRKYNITHVNVQNNWQLGLLAYLKPQLKFKLIYTIHGYRHNHPLKAALAIGAIGGGLLMFTDRVISMSDYVSKKFWFLGYKTDRVFYMMNKPEYTKNENKIATDSLQMVFPAQFRQGKRQEILVAALKRYIDKTGDNSAILHLPGGGPTLPKIKAIVKEYRLEDNVRFYGKISLNEVLALYEKTNIALCSSNVETYGRCIAEPFMLGRCVITQKTGVAGDIIRHGENGYFFKNVKDLTDILIKLHENPGLISKTANQAFEDRKIFFPKNVMETYLKSISHAGATNYPPQ